MTQVAFCVCVDSPASYNGLIYIAIDSSELGITMPKMYSNNDDNEIIKKKKKATGSVKVSPIALPKKRIVLPPNTENCLACSRFSKCGDPDKAFDYVCGRYKAKKSILSLEDFDDDASLEISESTILKPKKKKLKLIARNASDDFERIKQDVLAPKKKQILRVSDFSDETSADFDLEKIISSLTDTPNGAQIDLRVDDRDMPEAKNFMDFCLNFIKYTPFAKQLEIGLNLFNDICTNPKCTDIEYSKNIPTAATYDQILSSVTLYEHGKCPFCKETRLDSWNKRGTKRYNELAGLAGQRGGKSRLLTLIAAYVIHRYLKLQNPVRVLNLMPNEILYGIFTATTASQATDNIFDPLHEILQNSPWFIDYHKMLDFYSKKYGEQLYDLKSTFFKYAHRRMVIYATSPDKKNMRGRTSFLGGIDELGWFFAKTQQAVKLDPDEIYSALSNSFLSVRSAVRELHEAGYYNMPSPIFANISSPSSSRDKMVRLVKEAENSNNIYAFHYSVFDMNPRIKPIDLEQVAKSEPVLYRRNFLALPPDSAFSFIHDRKSVLACVNKKRVNAVRAFQSQLKSAHGVLTTGAKIKFKSSVVNEKIQPNRLLALDAGHTHDSFAACVLHLEDTGDNMIVVVDAVVEIIPKPGEPVNFTVAYEKVIIPLIERLNISYVCADRWNSVKMLQDIEDKMEIQTNIYSVSYRDMLELREAIVNQRIELPKGELKLSQAFKVASRNYPFGFESLPVSHLMVQTLTVEDNMGKKVDKGYGYTDDIFRALALGHAMVTDEEIQGLMMFDRNAPVKHRDLGVVGSYGAGGRSMSQVSSSGSAIAALGSYGSGGNGNAVFSRGR